MGVSHGEVKKLAISFLQEWGLMFKEDEQIKYMYEVYQECKRNGMSFPPPPTVVTSTIIKTKEVKNLILAARMDRFKFVQPLQVGFRIN